jgi:anthranilate phosphoribosyltransferase
MKNIIDRLYAHEALSTESAYDLLLAISNNELEDLQIASILTVFIMRPIETKELLGFQKALLELSIPFDLEGQHALDVCGTGGDKKNTFNISTLAAFVVAGAGYKVVKHGNYGVSSLCGSSNVLEYFGIKFSNDEARLNRALEQADICFLHAPLFHPAMKAVAPIRRSLAVRTFFNMLGPLVNPARPSRQLTGVFNLDLARKYHSIQSHYERNFMVIHSLDAYDEVSLTAPTKYFTNKGEGILGTEDFRLDDVSPEEIFGGEQIQDAAAIFSSVLENKGSKAQTNVVIANAALGIHCFDFNKSLEECALEARESIESGKALERFKKLLQIMH